MRRPSCAPFLLLALTACSSDPAPPVDAGTADTGTIDSGWPWADGGLDAGARCTPGTQGTCACLPGPMRAVYVCPASGVPPEPCPCAEDRDGAVRDVPAADLGVDVVTKDWPFEDRPAPMDVSDVPQADVAADVLVDVRVSCDAGSPDAAAYLCGGQCCRFACCNGVCADTSSNRDHCGGCGMACAEVPNGLRACGFGACAVGACSGRFLDCDRQVGNGCEVDRAADIQNCGECGRSCVDALIVHATPSCEVGACSYRCDPGYANCDGRIANGCERQLTGDAGCS